MPLSRKQLINQMGRGVRLAADGTYPRPRLLSQQTHWVTEEIFGAIDKDFQGLFDLKDSRNIGIEKKMVLQCHAHFNSTGCCMHPKNCLIPSQEKQMIIEKRFEWMLDFLWNQLQSISFKKVLWDSILQMKQPPYKKKWKKEFKSFKIHIQILWIKEAPKSQCQKGHRFWTRIYPL
jgi:hypothetical protein